MSALILLASFPNSRIESRSPTKQAQGSVFSPTTGDITALDRVVFADENRTYLYIFNDTNISIWYLYLTGFANINPSIVPTYGLPGDLFQNSVSGTLYQKSDIGLTTNWVVVPPANYIDVGVEVKSGERSIQITSLEMIVAGINGHGAYTGQFYIDVGQG